MRARNGRIPLLVAILAAVLALLHFSADNGFHPRGSSQVPASAVPNAERRVSTAAPGSSAGSASDSTHAEATAPRIVNVTPARLQVVAPDDAQIGDVFLARIDADVSSGMHELLFAVKYDTKRLSLVGWSEGTFAQARGLAAKVGAQEPSDGSIEVGFRLSNGQFVSGTGSIVVLQFEAIKAGTSAIALTNVQIADEAGATPRSGGVKAQEKVVTIH